MEREHVLNQDENSITKKRQKLLDKVFANHSRREFFGFLKAHDPENYARFFAPSTGLAPLSLVALLSGCSEEDLVSIANGYVYRENTVYDADNKCLIGPYGHKHSLDQSIFNVLGDDIMSAMHSSPDQRKVNEMSSRVFCGVPNSIQKKCLYSKRYCVDSTVAGQDYFLDQQFLGACGKIAIPNVCLGFKCAETSLLSATVVLESKQEVPTRDLNSVFDYVGGDRVCKYGHPLAQNMAYEEFSNPRVPDSELRKALNAHNVQNFTSSSSFYADSQYVEISASELVKNGILDKLLSINPKAKFAIDNCSRYMLPEDMKNLDAYIFSRDDSVIALAKERGCRKAYKTSIWDAVESEYDLIICDMSFALLAHAPGVVENNVINRLKSSGTLVVLSPNEALIDDFKDEPMIHEDVVIKAGSETVLYKGRGVPSLRMTPLSLTSFPATLHCHLTVKTIVDKTVKESKFASSFVFVTVFLKGDASCSLPRGKEYSYSKMGRLYDEAERENVVTRSSAGECREFNDKTFSQRSESYANSKIVRDLKEKIDGFTADQVEDARPGSMMDNMVVTNVDTVNGVKVIHLDYGDDTSTQEPRIKHKKRRRQRTPKYSHFTK